MSSAVSRDVPSRDTASVGRLLGAGVWLIFLGNPLGRLLDADDRVAQVVGVAALAVFVVIYLHGLSRIRFIRIEAHPLTGVAYLAALLVCFALVIPGAGDQSMTCLVFVAALATATLPTVAAWAAVAACAVGITVAASVVPDWASHGNNLAVLLAAAAVWSFRLAWVRQARLSAAERDLAELAVEEERARIARDLHDILGHSLTVISVKAELADRLLESDAGVERVRAEVQDLMRLSRDALADVRATARGIRSVSLPAEIASARVALESAGIAPHLPTVADDVPSDRRELFAWTLREGVTNVIRHSGATRCDVEITPAHITVADDGRGAVVSGSDGSGLDGLRRRAEAAGARVSTRSDHTGGFALTVELPA